ncbi:hypothetical protein PVIIG_03456 [Plasmodium vivax India VII]|uniref:Uncharacterized protein n=5 Tax=Plasmodium vivax TaxID=5855 RepID=A5KBS8_PLAVS|nr:hypothetical protein PVX_002560 [Plasmodium vivax]KMZ82202.1 hypothetical protein PVIIG_03456 [Plasmodium vivax India VII]KMZ88327.1 hypothetical protein PVBG_04526 [Plasmodium vivax Brazil I]KMZ94692.1 hypothetical protein PVMG_02581 [Plasmodium vivax Mauritania I]KNA01502.1 hypothetical protein PVNG_04827 [Plasmodium vivax North Korean]EDL43124.1 hypothetical protein PVX_002560 [Plasmodium vivax]|eukprot:XP_001612851.1 hypothetical protein [Plasmodium vivax Sal-1]
MQRRVGGATVWWQRLLFSRQGYPVTINSNSNYNSSNYSNSNCDDRNKLKK